MPRATVGLLLSGGIDSAVLLGELIRQDHRVQPFYIRCHLRWEEHELRAVRELLAALGSDRVAELVVLEQPVGDLYDGHWSVTGDGVPGAATPDEAVYLPGRNPLLLTKAAIWCQMNGIREIALAPLDGNPFPDASDEFFESLETMLGLAGPRPIKISRPFDRLSKRQVLQRSGAVPLEHTFSCIDPVDGTQCGRCNKCAERRRGFAAASMPDPTRYASTAERGDR